MANRVRRAWRHVRGFFRSRDAVARESVSAMAAVEAADARASRAELVLSSLSETLKMRDREIAILQAEKSQLVAQVEQRGFELQLLNQWLERVRKQIDADIAQEVARESRALNPQAARGASNQPPS